MTLSEKIADRLVQLKDTIVGNIRSNGITASGRTERSFEVVTADDSVRLVARAGDRAPLQTLEVGRPGGNVPGGMRMTKAGVQDVSNTFKAILVQWGQDKGIADWGWGQATMLGRRIAAEGTRRHEEPVDVYSSAVKQAAQDIEQMLLAEVQQTIKGNFNRLQ